MNPFILAALIFLFSGCSSECDVSTAENAAGCICELNKKYSRKAGDEKLEEEIKEEFEKLQDRIEENITSKAYTMSEVEKYMEENPDCEN